jgi:hypothetical protein
MGGGGDWNHLPPGESWMCAAMVMVVLPWSSACQSWFSLYMYFGAEGVQSERR